MIGETGQALTAIEPGGTGRVRTHGEIWTATSMNRLKRRLSGLPGWRLLRVDGGVRASAGRATSRIPPKVELTARVQLVRPSLDASTKRPLESRPLTP